MGITIISLLALIVILLIVLIYRQSLSRSKSEDVESRLNDNRREISLMLQPLKEQIDGFKKEFQTNTLALNSSQGQLSGQVNALMKLNRTISDEAHNLAQALKGNSQMRGAWGEMVLETILDNAGLVKGVHYVSQLTTDDYGRGLTDRQGRNRRPDVVVTLPDNRKVIIDSKVTLNAYIEFNETEDSGEKKKCVKKLLDGVRKHIDEIVNANYPDLVEGAVELTIMFIPNEGAFHVALENDRKILEEAARKNIVIATPVQLFSILKLVDVIWKRVERQQNLEDISRVAGELYDKVADFVAKFENVGKYLDKAKGEYETTMRSIQGNRNSVTGKAHQLRNMGVKPTRLIPDEYISKGNIYYNEDE